MPPPSRRCASNNYPIDALALDADKHALGKALQWLEMLASERQWESSLSHALTLCLDEALSNVLMHAVKRDDRPNKIIAVEIRCATHSDRVELELIDDGPLFDPTGIASPPLADCIAQATVGGNGLRLMRHYLDTLQYTNQAGRNHLSMIKKRPSA